MLYAMDATTWEHLVAWTERETMTSEEAYSLATTMRKMLETFSMEDAEYSLSHGWTHVRNLL